ncbi:MAG: hypothetical protein KAS23_06425 [Anaerohalosphaera sp.]|nr:hypothetical protein [Anaerohalosphaera sp.]
MPFNQLYGRIDRLTYPLNSATIAAMTKCTQYICAAVILLLASAGCQQPQNKPFRPSIEGIKITDLAPIDQEPLPRQIQFEITTFELPAQNYPEIEKAFDIMPDTGIAYNNKKMFTVNGFRAATGNQQIWPNMAKAFRTARVRKVFTSKLIIFDTQGDRIDVNMIDRPIEAFYIDAENHDTGIHLPPGTAAFKIRALSPQPGETAAVVNITAMHKKYSSSSLIPADKKISETPFDFTSMRMELAQGDYLLLGCTQYSYQHLEVKNLFFNFAGDYPMPFKNTDTVTIDLGYHIQNNVPLVRLYMFLCTRVDK